MYSTAIAPIQRDRLIAGRSTEAIVRITGPLRIAGTAVTVEWSNNDAVADDYRVVIGTTVGGSEIGDSGYIGNQLSHTFVNRTFNTAEVFITLFYRLGDGASTGITVRVPVDFTVAPPPTNEDPNLNWNDNRFWDDNDVWVE